MKRTLGTGALLVLTAMTAACSLGVFEDVGSDPHPPTAEIIELVHYVVPVDTTTTTPDGGASAPGAKTIFWDSGGFTLHTGELFKIAIAYTDAGGDIERFVLSDLTGPTTVDIIPTDQTYFAGTSGARLGPTNGIELTGVAGVHRLQLWAEDSHGSRSEKVEFVITFVL